MNSNKIVFCCYSHNNDSTSICARDIDSGVVVMTYRGDVCRQLVLVGGSYLVGCHDVRPKILVWMLNKKDALHTIPCASKVRSLSASDTYLVAGVDTSIHIWMISTGALLRTVDHHLQNVTSVKLQQNHLLVSGDEEGCVAVWSMLGLLQRANSHDPVCRRNEHTRRINQVDIFKATPHHFTIASASQDRSVRVWQGAEMQLQHHLELPHPATCVAIDDQLLIAALHDASLYTYPLTVDDVMTPTITPYKSSIVSMAVVGDGRVLVGMESGDLAVSFINHPPHKVYTHPGKILCVIVSEELQEGWSESSWKPPCPFAVLSNQPNAVVKEIGMVVKGHWSSYGEDDEEERPVKRRCMELREEGVSVCDRKKMVVSVGDRKKMVVSVGDRKKMVEEFMRCLYNNNA